VQASPPNRHGRRCGKNWTAESKHVLCLCDVANSLAPIVMESDSRRAPVVRQLFSSIAARYDLANHLLSGGMDFLWRRAATRLVAAWRPARMLDLATGSGDLALAVRAASPRSLVIAADFCPPMLLEARRKGLRDLVAADGLQLPFADAAFDAVTVAFGLRNMASWPAALAEMRRVIAPGGHLLILDFSMPPAPLRWFYRPYLHHILPHFAALLTGEKKAYDYLGDSIETFPSGSAMCRLIGSAGFGEVKAQPMSGGIVSLYTAAAAQG
jgi:demethylmenaquinone methyltransferase/2-methoxy-6-polyprenyl-1,4-benzoquinol methylase